MEIRLDSKNALVCGGSQGIGAAIAYSLADAGANVTVLARNPDAIRKTLSGLSTALGQKHDSIQVDMNDLTRLKYEVQKKLETKVVYHIWINNTGGPSPGLLYKTDFNLLEGAFRQHVLAAQLVAELLIAPMKQNKYGRIINIISIGLKQPIENLGISNTIRGAIGSWSKTLSNELAQYGITVNNILPGYTRTERLNHLLEFRANTSGTSIDEVVNSIVKSVPAGRMAEPDEIAAAALFLSSGLASYINGINLPVDGGYLKTL